MTQNNAEAKPGSLKLLLTYEELSEATSLCVAYLKKLKKQGKLPFIQVGRRVRFDPVDVVAWLKKKPRGVKHDS